MAAKDARVTMAHAYHGCLRLLRLSFEVAAIRRDSGRSRVCVHGRVCTRLTRVTDSRLTRVRLGAGTANALAPSRTRARPQHRARQRRP